MKLSIADCYSVAWKSFAKWWIPLCLISGLIVVFQIVPRMLVRADADELSSAVRTVVTAVSENDRASLETAAYNAAAQFGTLMATSAQIGLAVFPVVALLTVVLLMYANWAVKNKREKSRPVLMLAYIAVVHAVLAVVKLVAFFIFVLPGVYLYVKLLFVSLVMLEGNKGAGAAMRISWRMTRGNFWGLFFLVLINASVQMLLLPTIIGGIPATGFVNTARAAAFRMIWQEGGYGEG